LKIQIGYFLSNDEIFSSVESCGMFDILPYNSGWYDACGYRNLEYLIKS